MPCLRVIFDNQEIDRRDLSGPVVIGRAADCELAVRDILLSRRHCSLEPGNSNQWRLRDLGSKNGVNLNGQPLSGAAALQEGDVFALGRLKVHFSQMSLAELGLKPLRTAAMNNRPADPTETLSGTFLGFKYLEPGEAVAPCNNPLPRPEPRRPAAYERENIDGLLNAIASSSWDSIYEQARKPSPLGTTSLNCDMKPQRRLRPLSPIDLSLQAIAAPPPPPIFRRRRAGVVALMTLILALVVFKCVFTGRAALADPQTTLQVKVGIPASVQSPTPDSSALFASAAAAMIPILL